MVSSPWATGLWPWHCQTLTKARSVPCRVAKHVWQLAGRAAQRKNMYNSPLGAATDIPRKHFSEWRNPGDAPALVSCQEVASRGLTIRTAVVATCMRITDAGRSPPTSYGVPDEGRTRSHRRCVPAAAWRRGAAPRWSGAAGAPAPSLRPLHGV